LILLFLSHYSKATEYYNSKRNEENYLKNHKVLRTNDSWLMEGRVSGSGKDIEKIK